MSQQPPPPQPHAPPPPGPPPGARERGDRGRRRGLRLVIGVLVVIALLLVALWAITELARTTTSQEQPLAADEVDALEVRSEAGSISIVVEERGDIAVRSELSSGPWDEISSDVTLAEGTLSVTDDCDRGVPFFTDCQVDHELAVPPEVLTSISIQATAGAIDIRGFDGELDVFTTAGRIVVSDFAGPTASLRSTAGQILVDARVAPQSIDASTTAGEIALVVPDEPYRVSTDTTAGSVEVDVHEDPDAERSLSASSTAGTIRITRQ
jgi:DUF4097 and DUF4098 domain-containing protein YvlB